MIETNQHGPPYESEKEGYYRGLHNGRGHFTYWTKEQKEMAFRVLSRADENKTLLKGYWAGYKEGIKEAIEKRKKKRGIK